MSQGQKFAFKLPGAFTNNKTFLIRSSDAYLIAYLNSRCAWFLMRGICSALRGGEWRLELRTDYLQKLAFPKIFEFVSLDLGLKTNAICDAKTNMSLMIASLVRRIPDLSPPDRNPKLSAKLKEWWKLHDFAAFRSEVKKCFKADILLKERSDWEDLFTGGKAEIQKLSAEINRNEDEINAVVYKLFDLTPEEIELLETSIGAR